MKATFGAGCFWGVEEAFRTKKGVLKTMVGYMGGTVSKPSYKQVCANATGHAEVVQITYDPAIISYKRLLNIFWKIHNPTTKNRQGWDLGSQYRSVIFYHSKTQQEEALQSKERLDKSKTLKNPIVTEIVKASTFYKAETYHQKYLMKKGLKTC